MAFTIRDLLLTLLPEDRNAGARAVQAGRERRSNLAVAGNRDGGQFDCYDQDVTCVPQSDEPACPGCTISQQCPDCSDATCAGCSDSQVCPDCTDTQCPGCTESQICGVCSAGDCCEHPCSDDPQTVDPCPGCSHVQCSEPGPSAFGPECPPDPTQVCPDEGPQSNYEPCVNSPDSLCHNWYTRQDYPACAGGWGCHSCTEHEFNDCINQLVTCRATFIVPPWSPAGAPSPEALAPREKASLEALLTQLLDAIERGPVSMSPRVAQGEREQLNVLLGRLIRARGRSSR
jgi:hypothetical protein